MKIILRSLLLCGAFVACVDTTADDTSMYLTGTEESAVSGPGGAPACTNPKKTLICHIPPGNPANAHEICVGNAAVDPHVTHHGDLVGACASTPPDGDGDDGDDEPPPPSDDGPVLK